jgi:hypothetical protein
MFFEQLERERFVALGKRTVAHPVREHGGDQLAVLGILRLSPVEATISQAPGALPCRVVALSGAGAHGSRPTFFSTAWKRGSLRKLS